MDKRKIANELLNMATEEKRFSKKNREIYRNAADCIIEGYEEFSHKITCCICGHVSHSDNENTKHFNKVHAGDFQNA